MRNQDAGMDEKALPLKGGRCRPPGFRAEGFSPEVPHVNKLFMHTMRHRENSEPAESWLP
jgi:hypothetical protein